MRRKPKFKIGEKVMVNRTRRTFTITEVIPSKVSILKWWYKDRRGNIAAEPALAVRPIAQPEGSKQ